MQSIILLFRNLLYLYKNISHIHWNKPYDKNNGLIIEDTLKPFDLSNLDEFDQINQLWEIYMEL